MPDPLTNGELIKMLKRSDLDLPVRVQLEFHEELLGVNLATVDDCAEDRQGNAVELRDGIEVPSRYSKVREVVIISADPLPN